MALAIAWPETAGALDGECLWRSLPVATRDRMVAAYARGGTDALDNYDGEVTLERVLACGGSVGARDGGRQLGIDAGRLFAVSTQEGVAREYLSSRGFSAAALERAYARLGPADRTTLRTAMRGALYEEDVDATAIAQVVVRAARFSGWKGAAGQPTLGHFVDYFVARAVREAYEAE